MAQDPVDCYADEPSTEILPFLSVTKPARLGLTGAKHGPVHNAYAENVFENNTHRNSDYKSFRSLRLFGVELFPIVSRAVSAIVQEK
ncbi:hypothetical protein DAPPUDRAFT_232681 [Daphnia pulex]|uniref:Uncharacterized protein n=1 Tax=Daphnia pulex TaxID=6669 RepID=E9FRD9_DAPPU|nr:hypothetical protein DAPPUDRAFT_232681 [Daphnia pulex]|eukprot:EFX90147.1 hypothetical protein DAPPUDRAFT_232681 [Daphnia pulex]